MRNIIENKLAALLIVLWLSLLFGGCESSYYKKVDFPFETIKTIPSKVNKDIAIIIIKTGIQGGATVPFTYQFYLSKDDKTLSYNKLFLEVRGLKSYQVQWRSSSQIDVKIEASRVITFKSEIIVDNDKSNDLYEIRKFTYN